ARVHNGENFPMKTLFSSGSGGFPQQTLPTMSHQLILSRHHQSKATKRHFLGTSIHVLFHSPIGVLFTLPSQYYFSIGHWQVFSLAKVVLDSASSTCPMLLGS
ncbi:hypothetical protein HAX54_010144, partial [Datura stramonium]|nr:hypothetical protein [Datura stramonium]